MGRIHIGGDNEREWNINIYPINKMRGDGMKKYKKPVVKILNCSTEKIRCIQNYSDDELVQLIRKKNNQADKKEET